MVSCNSSGVLTASKVVSSGRTRIASVRVMGNSSTTGDIKVYDSSTATTSGKKEITRMFVGGTSQNGANNFEFDMHGVIAAEGVYVVVTGTIAYSVEYY